MSTTYLGSMRRALCHLGAEFGKSGSPERETLVGRRFESYRRAPLTTKAAQGVGDETWSRGHGGIIGPSPWVCAACPMNLASAQAERLSVIHRLQNLRRIPLFYGVSCNKR